jgi:endonuclease/exonuclease/phosphatase family metal-dependent hydrolase
MRRPFFGLSMPGGLPCIFSSIRSTDSIPVLPPSMRIRLVTYNIHKGIGGVDRRYRPRRIVEAIARLEPDIVLMQEVDYMVPRSKAHNQVDMFADAMALYHRAFQRNVVVKRGHYGNAILSRFPLSDVQHLDLTIPLKKRRQALLAHCTLHTDGHRRRMLLVNIHLGLAGFERRKQLAKIFECEVVRHSRHRTPLIIAGDYNDVWGTLGKRVMEPAGFHSAGKRILTFPAALPARPLDHVFYRGEIQAVHAFASRSDVARAASDHLPFVVDFRLPPST